MAARPRRRRAGSGSNGPLEHEQEDLLLCIELHSAVNLASLSAQGVNYIRVGFVLAGQRLYESEAYSISSSSTTLSPSAYVPASVASTLDRCAFNESVELRFDTRHLKSLKKSRTPLKLVLEAADGAGDKRDAIGFVLLSYSALFNTRQVETQPYRLQSSRVTKPTPELLLSHNSSWMPHRQPRNSPPPPPQQQQPESEPGPESEEQGQTVEQDEYEEDFEVDSDDEPQMHEEQEHDRDMNPHVATPSIVEAEEDLSSPPPSPPLSPQHQQLNELEREESGLEQFRVSIELRSIAKLQGEEARLLSLQYIYSLFASEAPFHTHPAIHVLPCRQNQEDDNLKEIAIPNSFCAYEFESSSTAIEEALKSDPLVIELLQHSDAPPARRVGIACLDLKRVLFAPIQSTSDGDVRTLDTLVPIFQCNEREGGVWQNEDAQPKILADLRVIVFVERLYDSRAQPPDRDQVDDREVLKDRNAREPVPPPPQKQQQQGQGQLAEDAFGRGGHAYQVAWELEMWKRNEQEEFEIRCAELEAKRLSELEQEWRRQTEARNADLDKRQLSISKLEKNLQQALFDVRSQERALRLQEQEQVQVRETLRREYEVSKKDTVATLRRARKEMQQELDLLQREKLALRNRLADLESSHDATLEEFRLYKKKSEDSSIGRMEMELKESQGQLHACQAELQRSKARVQRQQAQLRACLGEVARLRREKESEERHAVQRERMELQRLKLQMVARQQHHDTHRERGELQSIQLELQRLMRQQPSSHAIDAGCDRTEEIQGFSASKEGEATSDSARAKEHTYRSSDDSARTVRNAQRQAEIERLQREKCDLLKTGVYSDSHPVVVELQQKIQHLASR